MAVPAPTLYHRWLGWHAPALRRLVVVTVVGAAVGGVLVPLVAWHLALLTAWDTAALTFLAAVWPMILRTNGAHTGQLATREDMNRDSAGLLLLVACGISLVAVSFALVVAKQESGAERAVLIAMAALTVVVSWSVVNTVFTLRYARLYYGTPPTGIGIDFGQTPDPADQPDYRDFAYLAFTIGMTYQVSDTTLRDRHIRRTVLVHAGIAYFFGVIIVAAGVNAIAGLVG